MTPATTTTSETGPDTDELAPLARRCWQALETVHIVGYFAPETTAAYGGLGLDYMSGYFASRSAPMGAVPPEVTEATFFVFAPVLVRAALPAAWATAPPERVLDARHRGVAEVLHRVLGEPDVTEAVELARTACAGLTAPGRPLYAGHASLPWPADPLLALWHAATLLREYRGDGHVATLVLAGLDPVEALVLSGLMSGLTPFLKATRGWTPQEWAAGEDRLRAGGRLDTEGAMTPAGTAFREGLESDTDRAAEAGWRHLGLAGCRRLLELVTPLRRELLGSDVFPAALASRR